MPRPTFEMINHTRRTRKPKIEETKEEPKNTISSELDLIIGYESGELSNEKVLELFSMLVKNGHAWTLQGSYGRMAHDLIQSGFLDREGNILRQFSEDEA